MLRPLCGCNLFNAESKEKYIFLVELSGSFYSADHSSVLSMLPVCYNLFTCWSRLTGCRAVLDEKGMEKRGQKK